MPLSIRRIGKDATGAVLVEFALTLPVLLLIFVAIADFGLLFQKYQVVTNAAREGARMAVLPGYSTADVQNRVNAYLAAGGASGTATTTVTAVAITPTGGGAPFAAWRVSVTLTHTFAFLGPIATLVGATYTSVPLTAVSVMRTEVAAGGT